MPLTPLSNGAYEEFVRSHIAIERERMPPAVVKPPPMKSLLPARCSAQTVASPLVRPEPSEPHELVERLHVAIAFAVLPPARVKRPPTKTVSPETTSART